MADNQATITVIGLDLIGTSIGLSLRENAGNYQVLGHDRDPARLNAAKRLGGIDSSVWNLHKACDNASLVISTEPLTELAETLEHIREDVADGAVIFSIGTVMQPALEIARSRLPGHVHFVVGRPVLTDISGQPAPRVDLLNESTFCIGAGPQTEPSALELVSNLLARLGAKPLYIDPTEHDGVVSAVEQLPEMLAAVIFQTASAAPGWDDSKKLAGRRFALSTGLDASAEELAADLYANRAALVQRLDQLSAMLTDWRQLLAADDSAALQENLEGLMQKRGQWEQEAKLRDWDRLIDQPSREEQSNSLGQMLFGNLFRGRPARRDGDGSDQ